MAISIHALTRSATPHEIEYVFKTGISIHALTRSATVGNEKVKQWEAISIHALTRSATSEGANLQQSLGDFNPRTHEECDIRLNY